MDFLITGNWFAHEQDFARLFSRVLPKRIIPQQQGIILTGNICSPMYGELYINILQWLRTLYKKVILIPGPLEVGSSRMELIVDTAGIIYLDNKCKCFDGVIYYGSYSSEYLSEYQIHNANIIITYGHPNEACIGPNLRYWIYGNSENFEHYTYGACELIVNPNNSPDVFVHISKNQLKTYSDIEDE